MVCLLFRIDPFSEEGWYLGIQESIYRKLPVLRLPLGLSRSGLISEVVLMTDIKYEENPVWDWQIGF